MGRISWEGRHGPWDGVMIAPVIMDATLYTAQAATCIAGSCTVISIDVTIACNMSTVSFHPCFCAYFVVVGCYHAKFDSS